MNSLKTMLMVGVLAVVAYGMYVSINNSPIQTPPEVAEDWPAGPPQVSLPGGDAAGFAMEGPSGFPSAGAPPIQGRSDELSPSRPFSERAPAPPFSPAPMPPEIASDLNAPVGSVASVATAYPPYGRAAPSIDSEAELAGAVPPPADTSLPDFDTRMAPPLPTDLTTGAMRAGNGTITSAPMPGMSQLAKPASTEIRPAFAGFLAEARRGLEQGRFRETLAILSARYGEPDQTAAESAALTSLLDQVAGTAIYSTEHHLEPAYVVQAGETLPLIAEKHNVPTELLAKINGITDPTQLQPGRELKVVRGPFRAVVSLERHELDLWLQDLYAGRFPVGVGEDTPELQGTFQVLEKNREPAYYSPTGRAFDPNDPLNPLGHRRHGLGGAVAIHGTNDEGTIGQTGGPGAVRLGNQDADDVFDILSLGSRVVIQR